MFILCTLSLCLFWSLYPDFQCVTEQHRVKCPILAQLWPTGRARPPPAHAGCDFPAGSHANAANRHPSCSWLCAFQSCTGRGVCSTFLNSEPILTHDIDVRYQYTWVQSIPFTAQAFICCTWLASLAAGGACRPEEQLTGSQSSAHWPLRWGGSWGKDLSFASLGAIIWTGACHFFFFFTSTSQLLSCMS